MSTKYPGGLISKTAPTPTGPYANSEAPGVWTLEQQAYWVEQGNWPTAGNVNPDAFIENLFQTWLYTGNGSSQTITNGVDLSGEGGMVWIKQRSATRDNLLFDTTRGATQRLFSNLTLAQSADTQSLTSFNSDGFSVGSDSGANINAGTYVGWTFREQPKFFDVVTWTGNSTAGRQISHNLGSVPGCIIVKSTTYTGTNWAVYHRSLTSNQYALQLNNTGAQSFKTAYWNSTTPTSTVFTLGDDADVNESAQSYVAYLFAHDAGGFGLSGTDNVISCGSFTTDGSGNFSVNLGYEPQFIMYKAVTAGAWLMFDNMRGLSLASGGDAYLQAQSSAAEATSSVISPNATGFQNDSGGFSPGYTYIYIAIRRGPMKVPTDGTKVFSPVARAGTGAAATITAGFPVDLIFDHGRNLGGSDPVWQDRLRGIPAQLFSNNTAAEDTRTDVVTSFASNTGITVGADGYNYINTSGYNWINYLLQRAPGFFDEVCYEGAFTNRQQAHNLGVVPEMMIVKARTGASTQDWAVYHAALGASAYLVLNGTNAVASTNQPFNGTTPTASLFYVGIPGGGNTPITNAAGYTYVAYLFATCPGVSKVGSYTGTGTTLQINCGFTAGSRFVMIKRTDSTGDWYVWDSARGIVAGNDPYLLLNSTAAEVTSTDYVDTYSAGFEISSTAPSAINASGGTFIFLAIA